VSFTQIKAAFSDLSLIFYYLLFRNALNQFSSGNAFRESD
jgi:hypothetical protein